MRPSTLALCLLLLAAPALRADDVEQLNAAYRLSVSETQGRLRLAQQALLPLKQRHDALQAQIDEKTARARQLNERANALNAKVAGIDDKIGRNLLKAYLALTLEMAGAMTQTGIADLGTDLFLKAANKLMAASDAAPEGGERPKHFLVALAEFRDEAQRLNGQIAKALVRLGDAVEELRREQAPLKADLDKAQAACAALARELDQAEREHDKAMATFVRVRDRMLAEAAEGLKRELDRPLPGAGSAAGQPADFGPYLKRLQLIVKAHHDNAWPQTRAFETEWAQVMGEARAHYQACQRGAVDAVQRANRSADEAFMAAARGLREPLLAEAKAKAAAMEELGRAVDALDLEPLQDFERRAAEGAVARAQAFLARSSLLDFRPDNAAPRAAYSPAEIAAEEAALKDGLSDLKACQRFIDKEGAAFVERLLASQREFLGLYDRYAEQKARHQSLLQLASFTLLPQMEPAKQALERASYQLSEGLLSAPLRVRLLDKLAETQAQLGRLAGLEAAEKALQGSGEQYQRLGARLGKPAAELQRLEEGRVKELLAVAQAVRAWERSRVKAGPQGVPSLEHAEQALLSRVSPAQHAKNAEEIAAIGATVEAAAASHIELSRLGYRLEDRRGALPLPTLASRDLEQGLEGARATADAFSRFFSAAENFMPALEAYASLVPGFAALEAQVLAQERARLARLKPLHAEIMGRPDKSALLGRYYEKKSGLFIGLSGDEQRAYERLQRASLPFGSEPIDALRRENQRLFRELNDLMLLMKGGHLDGPAVAELKVGAYALSEDALAGSVVLELEDLVDGQVEARGRCRIGAAPLAKVQASLDDGATWGATAQVEGADRFVLRFRPEPGASYRLKLKAKDARGQEGPAYPWGRAPELRYSGASRSASVEAALQALAEAYASKSRLAFMRGVSYAFQGYHENLRAAIERDFSAYDSITLRFDIDRVLFNPARDEAQADLRWTRAWVKQPSGASATESGEGRFKLALEDGRWRLLALAGKPLFGTALDDSILRPYSDGGDGSVLPVRYAQTLRNHMSWASCGDAGFSFVNGTVITSLPSALTMDLYLGDGELRSDSGGLYDVGPAALAEARSAPAGGYASSVPVSVGNVYIVKVGANFAKLRVRAYNSAPDCNGKPQSITFDWAYQPNGTPDLR